MNENVRIQLTGVLVLFLVTSGIGTAATATDVVLSPADDIVSPGETVSYDIVVGNANGGIGSFNVTVATSDSSVASIQRVQYADSPSYANQPTATDEVTVAAAGMDTLDSGPVKVATVTVAAEGAGTARIALSVKALGTEEGQTYRLANVAGESLTVRDGTSASTPAPDGGNGSGGGNNGNDDSESETETPDHQSDTVRFSPDLTATANETRTNVSVASVRTNTTIALDLDAPIGSNATAGNATSGSNTTLDGLNLTLSEDVQNGTVRVGTSNESTNVSTPEPTHATAVGYVDVELAGFGDDAVANASFRFNVDPERRDALGGNVDEITLYRYHNSEWQPLQTEHVTGTRYRAITPGFSTFAIGVDRANVTVTDTRLQRPVVGVDEPVSVAATLHNTGRATGTASIDLATQESVLRTETVRLDSGETETVRLNASLATPSEYALTVGNDSVGNVTITAATTATPLRTTTASQTSQRTPARSTRTSTSTGGDTTFQFTGGASNMVLVAGAVVAVLLATLALRRRLR